MPTLRVPIDMQELFRSVVEEARATHPDMDFVLRTEGDMSGSFDAVRLYQLFSNLLLNAAQYGLATRPVSLDAQREEGKIIVNVKNYGAEIPFA